MSSSGRVTTERVGGPWSPISATELIHKDDEDDDFDDDDDADDDDENEDVDNHDDDDDDNDDDNGDDNNDDDDDDDDDDFFDKINNFHHGSQLSSDFPYNKTSEAIKIFYSKGLLSGMNTKVKMKSCLVFLR